VSAHDDVASDNRDLSRIRRICERLPGCDEGQLQDRPLFRVGNRRFALFNGNASPPRPRWNGCGRSLHVLVHPEERDALRQDARFRRSPHHGDRGWMSLDLETERVDWSEVAELLEAAWRQVANHALVGRLDRS
jgi:predicted DNA-binding protein (MmcQ/YjbR family)